MQAEQGERRRQAEVAASEAAGQAAIAAAAQAHDAATSAAQRRFSGDIADMKAQLTKSEDTARTLQAACAEAETSQQRLGSACGGLREELLEQAHQHRVRPAASTPNFILHFYHSHATTTLCGPSFAILRVAKMGKLHT